METEKKNHQETSSVRIGKSLRDHPFQHPHLTGEKAEVPRGCCLLRVPVMDWIVLTLPPKIRVLKA